MTDHTDYSKCSLCGDFAIGGIKVTVTSPNGRHALQRQLCPACIEQVQDAIHNRQWATMSRHDLAVLANSGDAGALAAWQARQGGRVHQAMQDLTGDEDAALERADEVRAYGDPEA